MSTNLYAAKIIRVGVLLDEPVRREYVALDQIINVTQDLNKNEFNIEFPDNKFKHGSLQVDVIKN